MRDKAAILKYDNDVWNASFQKSDGEHRFIVESHVLYSTVLLPPDATPSSVMESVHKACFHVMKQLLLASILQVHLNDLTLGTNGEGQWC